MKKIKGWLIQRADGVFEVDPDVIYPKIMAALGIEQRDLDQYWLETVYQITKLEVQRIVFGDGELDTRTTERPMIAIHIRSGKPKDRWRLDRYPPGRGSRAASKGLEARERFARLRGSLPM